LLLLLFVLLLVDDLPAVGMSADRSEGGLGLRWAGSGGSGTKGARFNVRPDEDCRVVRWRPPLPGKGGSGRGMPRLLPFVPRVLLLPLMKGEGKKKKERQGMQW